MVELDLSAPAEGTPKIASYDVEIREEYEVYKLTKSGNRGKSG